MRRSKSSTKWLKEHFDDVFVKKAQTEGYRSRAVYKLKEVDEKEGFILPGKTIVDLGASPGGWVQYVSEKCNGKGKIIALDRLPMDPVANVDFILGDFQEDDILEILVKKVSGKGVDVLLSDMAPNMSGNAIVDIPRAMYLAELALDFAEKMLKPRGIIFMKIFHGEGFDELVRQVRNKFDKVIIRKPVASRSRSRETYLLAKGYNL